MKITPLRVWWITTIIGVILITILRLLGYTMD